jgi:hypothetical protein
MPTLKQIIFASVLVLALLTTAVAQESTTAQRSALTITASAAGERVRITAPSSVVQMRMEVYAASGEKLFDQEIRGGNVFDWHLQDGQAQRLAPGAYVCVVTAKSVSGKLTQKIGTVRVEENSVSVQPAEALSASQAQTIGPVEENSSWTIPGQDEPQTPTVIAHDGTDGQMIRGRGALSFRIGNFFSGIDQEQMRLTEAGDLGLGTSEPKAKLDVAGTIRAERFVVVKPSTPGSKTQTSGATQTADSAGSVQPLVAGTGTLNHLAKWAETGGSGTLGDSAITETAGNVGIGTTSPTAPLTIQTPSNAVAMKVFGRTDHFGFLQFYKNDGATLEGSLFAEAGRIGLADAAGAQVLNVVSGNVGIGTTSPSAPLTVQTPSNAIAMKILGRTDHFGFLQFYKNGGTILEGSLFAEAGRIGLADSAGAQVLNVVSGNVGIGTTNPLRTLQLGASPDALFTFSPSDGTPNAGFIRFGDSTGWKLHFARSRESSGGSLNTGTSGLLMTIEDNGNIGVGTANPQTKLDVRGEVKLGSTGQFFAAGGDENLRIIRGTVNAAGNIDAGSGFTVSVIGGNFYKISFTTPFSGVPTVTANCDDNSPNICLVQTNPTSSFAFIAPYNGFNFSDATDAKFHFIAIGPR